MLFHHVMIKLEDSTTLSIVSSTALFATELIKNIKPHPFKIYFYYAQTIIFQDTGQRKKQ